MTMNEKHVLGLIVLVILIIGPFVGFAHFNAGIGTAVLVSYVRVTNLAQPGQLQGRRFTSVAGTKLSGLDRSALIRLLELERGAGQVMELRDGRSGESQPGHLAPDG